jgi:hypothetical protein
MTVAHGFDVQREPVGKGITARITLPGDSYRASSDAVPVATLRATYAA